MVKVLFYLNLLLVIIVIINIKLKFLRMERKGLRWMICHDGSPASIDAINTVHYGLLGEHDILNVANIWNKEKEEYLKL